MGGKGLGRGELFLGTLVAVLFSGCGWGMETGAKTPQKGTVLFDRGSLWALGSQGLN